MHDTPALTLRQRVDNWIEDPRRQNFIIGVIVFNALMLGLETSLTVREHVGGLLNLLDILVLTIFVVEIALKLFGRGWRFFTSGWNVFDFLIVAIALVPSSGPFAVLRALRILRLLRLVNKIPRLRKIIESLLLALPGIGWVALLLVMVFYIFAVLGTNLFGATFPDWFGTLGASFYTLFQVMTLESWSMGIARPVIEAYPWAWLFFVPFILISTFTVLNLFIAIIVSTMQSMHEEEERAEREAENARHQAEQQAAHDERVEILEELRRVNERLARMESAVREGGRG